MASGLAAIFSSQTNLSDAVSGAATTALDAAVGPVEVASNFFPTFTINPFAADGSQKVRPDGTVVPGAQLTLVDRIGLLVQPQVRTKLGSYAPYGAPSSAFLPHLLGAGALLVAGGALLAGAGKIARNVALVAGVLVVAGEVRRRYA